MGSADGDCHITRRGRDRIYSPSAFHCIFLHARSAGAETWLLLRDQCKRALYLFFAFSGGGILLSLFSAVYRMDMMVSNRCYRRALPNRARDDRRGRGMRRESLLSTKTPSGLHGKCCGLCSGNRSIAAIAFQGGMATEVGVRHVRARPGVTGRSSRVG